MLTLITGVFISIGLAVLGILINHYKCYKLIAGYHRATEEVKNQYDIQGLAEHIGNGYRCTISVVTSRISGKRVVFDKADLVNLLSYNYVRIAKSLECIK